MTPFPKDRAAVVAWAIRRIAPDVTDRQAKEIESLLRDEFAEVKAEIAAERAVEE